MSKTSKLLKQIPEDRLLVQLKLKATKGDGTHFSGASYSWNLSQSQFNDMQKLLVNGFQADLIALGDKHAAASEAPAAAPIVTA